MNRNQTRRQFISRTAVWGMTILQTRMTGLMVDKLFQDHFLLGCSSLETGMGFIKDKTGVEPVRGGKHPNVGTHNALISLGGKSYLEIIAPDPNATNLIQEYAFLKELPAPALFMWAARTENMDELLKKVQQAGYKNSGINAGSRQRTDGRVLKWRSLSIETDFPEVVPFFIEWDKGSGHPSVDSPLGCTIGSFDISYPDTGLLKKLFDQLSIEVPVIPGEKAALHLKINSPNGVVSL